MNIIRIIAVGKVKEKYLLEGIREYEKRIRPFCKIQFIELKEEGIKKDSEKIKSYLGPGTFILDSKGTQLSSEEFADFIKNNSQLTFIIGGSEGLLEEVKKQSKLISLSRMTFIHEMCRLFLIEQVYRAFMIINKRVYHK